MRDMRTLQTGEVLGFLSRKRREALKRSLNKYSNKIQSDDDICLAFGGGYIDIIRLTEGWRFMIGGITIADGLKSKQEAIDLL